MRRVFISYCHKDAATAAEISSYLRSRGVGIWIDTHDIIPGDSLVGRVQRAIDDVEVVVPLLSPDAVASPWVEEELDAALALRLCTGRPRIVPLLVADCELPPFLRSRRFIDLRGRDQKVALEELIRMLEADHDVAAGHGPATPRPIREAIADHARTCTPVQRAVIVQGEKMPPWRAEVAAVVRALTETDVRAALALATAWLRGPRGWHAAYFEGEVIQKMAGVIAPADGRATLDRLAAARLLVLQDRLDLADSAHRFDDADDDLRPYRTTDLLRLLVETARSAGVCPELTGPPRPLTLSDCLSRHQPAPVYAIGTETRARFSVVAFTDVADTSLGSLKLAVSSESHNRTWLFRSRDLDSRELRDTSLSLLDLEPSLPVEHDRAERTLEEFDDLGLLT